MKRFSGLLAAAMASLAITGVSNAQFGSPQAGTGTLSPPSTSATPPPLYDNYWHTPASSAFSTILSVGFLEAFFGGAGDTWNGGIGFGLSLAGGTNCLRLCYGIDVTQGGRNYTGPGSSTPGPYGGLNAGGAPSGAFSENTWFRWTQGFGPGDAGVDLGLTSVQAATNSSRGGDACFSPFNQGGNDFQKLGALAIPGLFPATSGAPFPTFWEFSLSWGPTPVLVPNKIGNDLLDPGIPTYGTDTNMSGTPNPPSGSPILPHAVNTTGTVAPLLANVIFEVQGPLNSALTNTETQYYLASTIDWIAINGIPPFSPFTLPDVGYYATGGITNGNGNQGFDIFGSHAGNTSATNATRVVTDLFIGLAPAVVTPLNQKASAPGPPPTVFREGRWDFAGSLAFATPKLWGYHRFQSHSVAEPGNTLGASASFSADGPGHTRPGIFNGGFLGTAAPAPVMEGRDGAGFAGVGTGFNLFTGTGGTDFSAVGAPLSAIDIIMIDHETGTEIGGNVYWKVGSYALPTTTTPTTTYGPYTGLIMLGPSPQTPAGFDTTLGGTEGLMIPGFGTHTTILAAFTLPCRVFTIAAFTWTCQIPLFNIWSNGIATPSSADLHPQLSGMMSLAATTPPSWQDGDNTTASTISTTREGPQNSAAVFIGDSCFSTFLSFGSFSFSSQITPSDDFFRDGPLDFGGGPTGVEIPRFASVFEGMWAPETSGQADLKPGGSQLPISMPQGALLLGVQLHLNGTTVAFDLCTVPGFAIVFLENSNGMTISVN